MVGIGCSNCNKLLERLPCRAKRNCYCNTRCQMQYEYKNKKRDPIKTTEKAHKAVIQKSINKFKTNPTKHISKKGYWMIYIPLRGKIKEHHWIWEQNNNRRVPKGYIIHHINHNKLDNHIENLQMMTKKAHNQLHSKLRQRNKRGQYK